LQNKWRAKIDADGDTEVLILLMVSHLTLTAENENWEGRGALTKLNDFGPLRLFFIFYSLVFFGSQEMVWKLLNTHS
jgi:hypothetical protein